LDGSSFAQTLVLGLLETPSASLNQLAHVASRLGVVITCQALDERLTAQAVMFLADLFGTSLRHFQQQQRLPLDILQRFSGVYLLDSTQIALPPALQTVFLGCRPEYPTLKAQLSLDYLTGNLNAIEWVDGRAPDQQCRLQVTLAQRHSLHLFDLGYFDQDSLAALADKDAFFLCRLQSQTAIFDPASGQRLALDAYVRHLKTDCHEQVWHIGARQKLPLRVILRRLPPSIAAQRRRKAKQKARRQHKHCTQAYLTLLGWDIFITNLPSDWLSADQVLLLYRIRWQVELYFKAWKSQLHLAHLDNWRIERVLCYLYARFIGVVLVQALFAPFRIMEQVEMSLTKAIQLIQKSIPDRLTCLRRQSSLVGVLRRLKSDFWRFARKDQRSKSPSTYARLLALC
jgi:hypothetical protein